MTHVMFVAGLVGLFLGGEFLIRGAVGVAQRLHIPPLVIGLTIVGFGTSTPELLVSLQAALSGAPALALGNVIGSNIANVLLILGLSALITTVPMRLTEMRRDFAVMIGATLVLWLMLAGGTVARWEGLMLVTALAGYLWLCLKGAAGSSAPADGIVVRPLWKSLTFALGGLVVLMVGARLLVDSSTEIARTFGVSEAVIGLTIVAIGTSLPELATAIIAAIRRHPEIAVGNILGSNVFNILGILGVTAAVTPIPVEARFAGLDMGLALAAALAMLGFAALAGRVGRLGGGALLAGYAGYVGFLGLG
ncbi:calcium/sodium antiporter [Defluviimonas sp. WL0024]|uniref:Calcium/sodium antiporter n=2 Tax=Albidovulum TaxID=205889 RepID=A0ABT3J0I9_9RHOB|nr:MULTISPECIES: calcium/sodium antiporter [Defluviimonas]MCU9846939.1 calcium/sodium antiporter [Defluviimonas sp. WL0024]MCW3781197.1 calcium/sodium antiporter [Defluviimonas salinarum]